ncbi:hypothetical protein GW17_00030211 [Ensete ventricosum]|nr:hypothetical protein GW17_00030211 [Ensete ventricosum]
MLVHLALYAGIINQTKEQTRYCLGMPSHNSKKIESHLKRLDEDLNQFAEDLKQGSDRKNIPASADVDQPIDPNEPTYCVCHQVYVKEVNGSIIHASDSLQKQDLKGSGSAQPVGINNDFRNSWPG